MNQDFRPYLVIWETTQAGTSIVPDGRTPIHKARHPLELDTAEAHAMIEQVARLQPESFLFTGGDPLSRADLVGLVDFATRQGLRVSLSSRATSRFAGADFQALHDAGLRQLSLSLEHSETAPGNNDALQIAHQARAAGIRFNVHTTFTRRNLPEFDVLVAQLGALKPERWSVFPTLPGNSGGEDSLTMEECAALSDRLEQLSQRVTYQIKTAARASELLPRLSSRQDSPENRAAAGVVAGRGFLFISHVGGVRPSNFYPITAGNVRVCDLFELYRRCDELERVRDSQAHVGEGTNPDPLNTPSDEPTRRHKATPAAPVLDDPVMA